MDPVLETIDLNLSFGGLKALNGVNLIVPKGELRAIIGPNGAGKTTLFNVISGALRPDGGKVMFKGQDITRLAAHQRVRAGLARIFQHSTIFPGLTVAENVWIGVNGRSTRPWDPVRRVTHMRRSMEVAEETCDKFGLMHCFNQLAGNISHGDQRLLEVAMAWSTAPEAVLLDEPTQGVSPGEVENLSRIIRDIARTTTVILIEHNMTTIMDVADKVTVLHYGEIIFEGEPADALNNATVREVYLGTAPPARPLG